MAVVCAAGFEMGSVGCPQRCCKTSRSTFDLFLTLCTVYVPFVNPPGLSTVGPCGSVPLTPAPVTPTLVTPGPTAPGTVECSLQSGLTHVNLSIDVERQQRSTIDLQDVAAANGHWLSIALAIVRSSVPSGW